jgi:RimJ/RimL family protein N-acetyltransferase
MSDDKVMQYIMCSGNEPVGQIRLNIEDKRAYIDYSIAPDKRGLGLGETMLKSMIKLLKDIKERNFTALTGQVKYENAASARVFEKCGFIRSDKSDYIEYVKALED